VAPATGGHLIAAMRSRFVYVSASTLPSPEANAVHVVHQCDALAGLGLDLRLRAARGGRGDLRNLYDLRHAFAIDYETPLTHKFWLARRRLARFAARADGGALYYGRRLPPLARLAAWGYPTAVELHHPPRTAKQEAALQRLVGAPGFRGLVAVSARLREALLARVPQLDAERVLVAPDGVRADRICVPLERGDRTLRAVYCGSFHAGKGVELILQAAAALPELRFDLIGGMPAQVEALQARAPANARFLGQLPHGETQRRLREYDIGLAPYGRVVRGARTPEHESLSAWMSPLKLFEYMGAGLPIVTSDLPVLRELLQDGTTALMPPPDDPAALAAAIRTLAGDPGLRLRLARAAQDGLRHFTWENRAARILDLLERAP
jgi:glycosyltransferase involved in cell wall biosynthesis